MQNYRTDLAMEAFDGEDQASLPGLSVSQWEESGITLTEVAISDREASDRLGKPCGRYLTLQCAMLRRRDPDARQAMAGLLSEELSRMLPEAPGEQCVLVVGLGNRQITPDALGPAVIDRTLVTRHLSDQIFPMSDMRPVCAMAPGVLGVTGIETMDVVESMVRLTRPAVVICIDSLAARDTGRIGSTVQLTDTGIQPGAGVGNRRRALTRESVGAPVIAIGVPTVIHAATLARDAFDWLNRRDGRESEDEAALEAMEQALSGAEIGDMIVTPREIDALIQDAAGIIASALNRALQPELTDSEIAAMMD